VLLSTPRLIARDQRLPALRHVHLLMNVLHRDVLVSARFACAEAPRDRGGALDRVAQIAERK
jgi:hypothetical protein